MSFSTIEIILIIFESILIPIFFWVIKSLIDSNREMATFKTSLEELKVKMSDKSIDNTSLIQQNRELEKEVVRLQEQIKHYEKRFDRIEHLLEQLSK